MVAPICDLLRMRGADLLADGKEGMIDFKVG